MILSDLNNESLRRLILGASNAFLLTVIGAGLSFLLSALLASAMGPEHFGIYAYVTSWLAIAILIALVGRDTTALRYVAAYKAKENWSLLAGFSVNCTRLVFRNALIIALCTAGALWLFRQHLNEELLHASWAACLVLPFWSFFQLSESFIRAYKHVAKALSLSRVIYPLFIITTVALWLFCSEAELRAHQVILITLAAIIVALLCALLILKKIRPTQLLKAKKQYAKQEWQKTSLAIFTIALFQIILAKTDIIMIGSLVNSHDTGIYAAAARISLLIGLGITSVNAILAPTISELHAKEDYQDLQTALLGASKAILVYALPASLFLIFFGKWVLLLFGAAFVPGYAALIILVIGQLFISLFGSVGFLMVMTGFQKEASYIIGTSAVLNIVLNLILIPIWGIEGAAFATTISVTLRSMLLYYTVRKKLNLYPSAFLHNALTYSLRKKRDS